MADLLNCEKIYLKKGSKGGQVSTLQTHLKSLGYYTTSGGYTLKIDGDFGQYTDKAVKAFQRAIGTLAVDGIVGQATCKKINEKIQGNNKTTPSNVSNTSNASTNKANSTSTKPTIAVNPYAPNPENNVMEMEEADISFDGIYFQTSNVTPSNNFHGGNWKTISMMSGRKHTYKGEPPAYEYSFDTFLENNKYKKILPELEKITERICNVTSARLRSGKYFVNLTVTPVLLTHTKVTFKLTEYMGE